MRKPQPDMLSELPDERWTLVKEILASPSFAKAPRLSSFLAYICAETLKGNGADLNERQIGTDVFGRPNSYLPAEDSIVRASARLLRNRLELYFSNDGKDSDWVIVIPKGSYIPAFEPRIKTTPPLLPAAPVEDLLPPLVPAPQQKRFRPALLTAVVVCSVFAIAVALVLHFRSRSELEPNAENQLWPLLIEPQNRTLFVPADSTLSLIQTERSVPLTLSEYLDQGHATMTNIVAADTLPRTLLHITEHQYTSIADLDMVFRLARLPQVAGGQLDVRYARDLTLSEAKNSNLILMGGPRANPWVQLFSDHLDYALNDTPANDTYHVDVRQPHSGEQKLYVADVKGVATFSLAVIAFVRGLRGDNQVLLIEGTDMAGTEGACDFLLNPQVLSAFLAKAKRPDGHLSHFEMLLGTKTIKGNASEPQVLAYRLLP